MSPTFFTTDDGDIIIRAGPVPGLRCDFRVHKLILSLASPVFKDMFPLPQPPDQSRNEGHQLPIVDIPEPPEVIDTILRLIYPGVELPMIPDLSTISSLLSVTDKYDLMSVTPVLRGALRAFLPSYSFEMYITACRFGFSEEAREAAMVSTTRSILQQDCNDAIQHISNTDLFRFVRFVQERELVGLSMIGSLLGFFDQGGGYDCEHWVDGRDFYYRLVREVMDTFVQNPCVEFRDLLAILDKVPDPPPGCEPPSNTAEFYRYKGGEEALSCPLLPMSIRNNLMSVAMALTRLNHVVLDQVFGGSVGGG